MGLVTEHYLRKRGYTTPAPEGYVCARECRALFGISETDFYHIAARLPVRVVRVGRTPLVHVEDLEAVAMRRAANQGRRRRQEQEYESKIDAMPPDPIERDYPRGLTHEMAVAAYYAAKIARVLADPSATRELPDGRIAIDYGRLFG